MAATASLREHLVDELHDLMDAEQQLIEALPLMAQRASNRQLQTAFRSHLAETRSHEKRVAQALRQLGEKADGKTCEAMKGLLEEGQELMDGSNAGALRDAMMITAAQKVEHYEIATYGTVRTYAQVLGEREIARLLDQTLREEKAADRKLTGIAEGSVNARASKEWHEHATATGLFDKSAAWIGSTVGRAAKIVMPRGQAADRTAGSSVVSSSSSRPSTSSSRPKPRARSKTGRSTSASRSASGSRTRARTRKRSNASTRRTRTARNR